MLRMALVGVPEELLDRLHEHTLMAGIQPVKHRPSKRPPRPPGADFVLIDGDCDDPIKEAQRWFKADRALAVTVMVPGTDLPGLRSQVMTTPVLGKHFALLADDDLEGFAASLQRARLTAANRKRLERANQLVDRLRDLI